MTLSIGSHPDYRAGKYVIFVNGQPTQHWAASIKRIAKECPSAATRRREYPWVTDEMIDLVHAFDWPSQREPEIDEGWGVDLRCACGELVDVADVSSPSPVVCKTCGRRWSIAVTITEVTP